MLWRCVLSEDPLAKQLAMQFTHADFVEAGEKLVFASGGILIVFSKSSRKLTTVLRKDLYWEAWPMVSEGFIYCLTLRR